MPATASRPAISNQAEPLLSASRAMSVPNSETRAKVRRPALAEGLRSRSRPMSNPMVRLVKNRGRLSMPLPCNPCARMDSIKSRFQLAMAHDELQTLAAIVFIDVQAVHGADIRRRRLGREEADGVEVACRR